MTKRSIPLAIVLSFITVGLYALYWVYTLTEDAHAAAGERTTASGGMVILFSFLTCVLALFGFGIISYALMQSALNDIIDHDGGISQAF